MEDTVCDNIDSAIAALLLGVKEKGSWLFRGQSNDPLLGRHWELIPAVFRRGLRKARLDDQCQLEFNLLQEFLLTADEVGLGVPGDAQHFRNPRAFAGSIREYLKKNEWPPPSVFEVMAMAQHSGVPTRFLDFTYDARIAAFFAVISALGYEEPWTRIEARRMPGFGDFYLSVWAINLDYINRPYGACKSTRVQLITVPKANNEFLKRQEGVFLYDSDVNRDWGRDDHCVHVSAAFSDIRDKTAPVIAEISIAYGIIEDLLEWLRKGSISLPQLMPTYPNVGREIRRRRKLDMRLSVGEKPPPKRQ